MDEPTRHDDQILVSAVQRGDAAALDALIERYHAPLSQYLERMLGDADLAHDLVQESFLRMIRALPRYRPQARFSTWLYTIATNVARDELRRLARQQRRQEPLEEHHAESDLAEPPRSVAEAALDQVVRDDVRRALAALSAEHRLTVVLHYYQGLSYKEIAEVCGCSVGTVGSRLHYAVRHLRRELSEG